MYRYLNELQASVIDIYEMSEAVLGGKAIDHKDRATIAAALCFVSDNMGAAAIKVGSQKAKTLTSNEKTLVRLALMDQVQQQLNHVASHFTHGNAEPIKEILDQLQALVADLCD